MPSMPGEDYSHLLNEQQRTAAESAARSGTAVDTRGQAIANIATRFDSEEDALSYIAGVKTSLEDRKTQLEHIGRPTADQKAELGRLPNQIRTTQTLEPDVLRALNEERARRITGYQAEPFDSLKGKYEALRNSRSQAERALVDAQARFAHEPDKIKPFQSAFESARRRFEEADQVYQARLPQERAKEISTEQGEADRKRGQYRRESLEVLAGTVEDLRQREDRLNRQIADAYTAGDVNRANALEAELNKTRTEYAEVSSIYNARRASEGEVANVKFREMTPEERAKELQRLGQDLDQSTYNYDDLDERLFYGERLTKEELAVWADQTANRLIEGGEVNMNNIYSACASRPELRHAIFDKVRNSDQVRRQMRERFPNGWQRMLDFARRHPGFLWILLAIVGGSAVAAIGPANVAVGAFQWATSTRGT